jgi:murein DD-endopeptidase MepM/ murein hydrolase activator NlpD
MECPLDNLVLRGNDPTGHGYYGAKRGSRKHKGVDLVGDPNDCVYSPIHGTVTRVGKVYSNTNKFDLVEISNDMYRIKLMYVKLEGAKVGQRVFEKDIIGKLQDVAGYWNPMMLNHLHFEVYKNGMLTDGEPLLTCRQ